MLCLTILQLQLKLQGRIENVKADRHKCSSQQVTSDFIHSKLPRAQSISVCLQHCGS